MAAPPASEIIAVELLPPDPRWLERANRERENLERVLGEHLVCVHHIGSTSIPNIKAKPIVDLLPVVRNTQSLDAIKAAIVSLGYDWMGEFGLVGRRYCRFNNPQTGKREVQLHIYAVGNAEIQRHLAFRDYLRAHPVIAKEYEAEKIRAAARQPHNTLAYNDEKNGWIKRVEREALAWVETQNK
jgi:GrpB-like predicted nucleotidyltransferase (UPF0157 family)